MIETTKGYKPTIKQAIDRAIALLKVYDSFIFSDSVKITQLDATGYKGYRYRVDCWENGEITDQTYSHLINEAVFIAYMYDAKTHPACWQGIGDPQDD